MANVYNATYKRFNGIDWDTFYFATTAGQVAESSTRKWLSDAQQTAINNYLMSTFNATEKLARVEIDGKLPVSIIPALAYLALTGGTMSGSINMQANNINNVGLVNTNLLTKAGTPAAPLVLSGYSEVDAGNVKIINLADPQTAFDAANKAYVDMMSAQGSHLIGAVIAASTSNIPTLSGTMTIDGVALVAGDRVLVKNQTTVAQNGVYIVQTGAWTKLANDSDKGSLVSVLQGTTQQRNQWYNQDGTTWVLHWVDDDYGIIANSGLEVDGTGLRFGIADNGVTTARILNLAVTDGKIANVNQSKVDAFASSLAASISDPATAKGLNAHIQNIYKMIQLAKGTAGAHDTLTPNITTNYELAVLKNRTFIGSAAPSTAGYTTGDLYFQHT